MMSSSGAVLLSVQWLKLHYGGSSVAKFEVALPVFLRIDEEMKRHFQVMRGLTKGSSAVRA